MGWVVQKLGWMWCFRLEGLAGLGLALLWLKTIYGVKAHPRISQAEIQYIEEGGGLASLDAGNRRAGTTLTWPAIAALLSNRMLQGIYLGQYCITTLTWFFLTWFPIYLNQARHIPIVKVGFLAALPALCGFGGGILGGVISDRLLRSGHSLTFARKVPIVLGMMLAITMIGCNYVSTSFSVMILMCIAFFGKGIGALGWTVISDTSPRDLIGINGGLFNLIGNLAGVTTPIVIGLIVKYTGSFQWALVFVAATALLAIVAYLPIVGEIKRVELAAIPAPEVGA